MGRPQSLESNGGKHGALLCLSLSMLLASLGTSIANITLPTLVLAFAAPFHQVQWVVITYLTTLTLFVVITGRLGDRFGKQQMLVLGLVLFSLASAACGLAFNLWILVAARAVQGIGAAFMMTLTIALVRETIGTKRIGRAMGMLGTMSAVGTALGPSLGGVLVGWFGWPAVFHVLAVVGLLAAGLSLRMLPAATPTGDSPRIGFSALRESGIGPGLASNLLVANVMMATLLVGPFYLAFGLHLPETTLGLVMTVGPVISICTAVPSGQLVDKWGAQPILLFGLCALASGAFALAALPEIFGLVGYLLAVAILTPGYQMFQSANNTMIMAEVPADQRGTISGLLGLSRNIGLICGASVMGAVFSFGAGPSAIEDAPSSAITYGLQLTFMLCGLSILVAFWFSRRFASNPDAQ